MSDQFDRVVAIMAQLRAPGGCPWDQKQTHESLKPYLIEETYEALDTIDRGDFVKLKEELGDVLLQVLFHSQIGSEQGTFTIDEVVQQLGDKLVRRHPHVFEATATGEPTLNSDQVIHRWEDIKRAERKNAGKAGIPSPGHSSGTSSLATRLSNSSSSRARWIRLARWDHRA